MCDSSNNIIIKIEEKNTDNTAENPTNDPIKPPKFIFIVPYRDREQHLIFFKRQMKYVLEDMDPADYKIYYLHQCDKRSFNRGAMKNIGFLAMREKYPQHYKNITFIFNDVDTMPFSKNFLNYDTVFGNIKHFYGFKHTLGGIVSIKGIDFERIHGYPNFWAWGFEDNMLYDRVLKARLNVDRSRFFPYPDQNILHFNDGYNKPVNRAEFDRYAGKTAEGWSSIKNLKYTINEETGFIDVTYFTTGINENPEAASIHDLRKGQAPFKGGRIARTGGTGIWRMNL